MRRRRRQRHEPIRPGHSGHHLRAARHPGLRGDAARPQPRFAQRRLRGIGRQSVQRAGPSGRQVARRPAARSKFPVSTTTSSPSRRRERKQFAALPFDEAAYLERPGRDAAWGEAGFTTHERRWARPTCDVNGIYRRLFGTGTQDDRAGTGHGKNHLPACSQSGSRKAPAGCASSFCATIVRPGLRLEFTPYHGCPASRLRQRKPLHAGGANGPSPAPSEPSR